MEFSLANITKAQQMYTGVDFPLLVAMFSSMGIKSIKTNIQTGKTSYEHNTGEKLEKLSFQVATPIAPLAEIQTFQTSLKKHQAGGTNFQTFCEEIASAGVAYWIVNPAELTCSYYSLNHSCLSLESIPKATLPTL
ncbi:MAG: DUF1398 family protein [Fusobacteriaceae bacterium]